MNDKAASVPHPSAQSLYGLATDRLVPGSKAAPDPEKGQLQPVGQAVAAEELGQYKGMGKPTGPSPVWIALVCKELLALTDTSQWSCIRKNILTNTSPLQN